MTPDDWRVWYDPEWRESEMLDAELYAEAWESFEPEDVPLPDFRVPRGDWFVVWEEHLESSRLEARWDAYSAACRFRGRVALREGFEEVQRSIRLVQRALSKAIHGRPADMERLPGAGWEPTSESGHAFLARLYAWQSKLSELVVEEWLLRAAEGVADAHGNLPPWNRMRGLVRGVNALALQGMNLLPERAVALLKALEAVPAGELDATRLRDLLDDLVEEEVARGTSKLDPGRDTGGGGFRKNLVEGFKAAGVGVPRRAAGWPDAVRELVQVIRAERLVT